MSNSAGRPDDVVRRVEALCRERLGRAPTRLEEIPAGLGTRRFLRVHFASQDARDAPHVAALGGAAARAPASAIARIDAPQDATRRPASAAAEPPLEPLRTLLEAHGLPVPARLAHGPGIELLEDLGGRTLEAAAHGGDAATRQRLYRAACAIVPRLQAVTPRAGVAAFSRHLDAALIRYKAKRVVDWLLPLACGRPPRHSEARVVYDAFDEIAECVSAAPQRLAHRDFKAQNLHCTVAGDARGPLVMIDLQGALLAPPEYDLVCLLRDLQVPLPRDEWLRHARETRPTLPDAPGQQDFEQRFTLLTLSRVGKDLSYFLQATQEGDTRYRSQLPAGVRLLHEASAHAAARGPRFARLDELLAALPPEPACGR